MWVSDDRRRMKVQMMKFSVYQQAKPFRFHLCVALSETPPYQHSVPAPLCTRLYLGLAHWAAVSSCCCWQQHQKKQRGWELSHRYRDKMYFFLLLHANIFLCHLKTSEKYTAFRYAYSTDLNILVPNKCSHMQSTCKLYFCLSVWENGKCFGKVKDFMNAVA